jgi:natural product biosynthesis luciferase-like monooxygenase protein
VRCALVGDESLAAQCADIALAAGLHIAVVATTHTQVAQAAHDLGIPVVDSATGLADSLRAYSFDVLLSIANLRILADEVLAQATTAINFHDGPLPAYAGLNVTTWAIYHDEPTHAITWHLMTSDVDAGHVVATETFAIEPTETAFSLNARCYEAAIATFPAIAAQLATRTLAARPQPDGEAHLYRLSDRPVVVVDATQPAADTARGVRALAVGQRINNTVGSPHLLVGGDAFVVGGARLEDAAPGAAAGTIVAVTGSEIHLATADGTLVLTDVTTPRGDAVAPDQLPGLRAGAVLAPAAELAEQLADRDRTLARSEPFWRTRLARVQATSIPHLAAAAADAPWARRTVELPEPVARGLFTAAVAIWAARSAGTDTATFTLADQAARERCALLTPLTHRPVVTLDLAGDPTVAELHAAADAELDLVARHGSFLADLVGRDTRTAGHDFATAFTVDLDVDGALELTAPTGAGAACVLRIALDTDRRTLRIAHRTDAIDAGRATHLLEQILSVLRHAAAAPTEPCSTIDVVGPDEAAELDAVNRTEIDYDRTATLDAMFRDQVARTPEAAAVTFHGHTLSYRQLADRVDRLAGELAARGVQARDRVGIATERGIDMVVAVLATLQVGAAYLPLDPAYPHDRLRFMVDDSGVRVVIGEPDVVAGLGDDLVAVDAAALPAERASSGPAPRAHCGDDLAYVIYTSGSTGTPKGVMLEHRNVVNFFAAMDDVIEHDTPGVWLAVTSLSFDISVLELLWTLTRGFHVVVKTESGARSVAAPSVATRSADAADGTLRPVTMSMFYFAAGVDQAADGYRLLLESARFADVNGFEAVWTPERHFHAFGGSYPNPSVVSAALAATTSRVHIRAGSVVIPLHALPRIAEEWAVVDNLSGGRVGISFAAGWQPNDFVLNPSGYANAREKLGEMIDTVQRLWRGESVELPGHDGRMIPTSTLPRPVQPELPVWLTSAGSTATFERAGTMGVNLLTHLLGQSVDQLGANIAHYRAAWQAAGHPGEGHVTLMLHTFLDRDPEVAKRTAHEPLKGYLGTAVGLLKDMASAFPTFAGSGKDADEAFKSLTESEIDQLLEMAASRYLETSGLFGTTEMALDMVETVCALGVDEVACLIDFGIDTDAVLASLPLLDEVRRALDDRRAAQPAADSSAAAPAPAPTPVPVASEPASFADLVAAHHVTHFQCTPSLATMLVADPADRVALRSIRHMMVGGEALPTALAAELRGLLPARFTNMYGPTETTIWSLVHEIGDAPRGQVPIGRPIGNNTVFVLDPRGRRLPFGVYGELHIGGDGVARGYHGRPELTGERFVERPGMGRVYATGDIARIGADGIVEFAGRADNQVKIRGHRIELGEIESVLDAHPDVVQSVVVARPSDIGDPRLVAFVVSHGHRELDDDALRSHVGEHLPEAMVPSIFARLDAFPLTPNGKVDRKALPTDVADRSSAVARTTVNLDDDTERLVATIWSQEMQRAVGRDDNFFEIGGHSLLAVKVFRRLSDETKAPLALTDVFRFPTVRTFAEHLAGVLGKATDAPAAEAGPVGTDRGAMRRRALTRRGGIQE